MPSLWSRFSLRMSEIMMSENNQNDENNDQKPNLSETIDESKKRVVDMLLSKNQEKTLDSETMILETQKRVWGAFKTRL